MGRLEHFMIGNNGYGANRAEVNIEGEGSGKNSSVKLYRGKQGTGTFHWTPEGGFIQHIEVPKHLQHKGAATDMYEMAKAAATENNVDAPEHSMHRTDEGDAWAKKVGGELPPRSNFLKGK